MRIGGMAVPKVDASNTPRTPWETVVTTTPVILTVIATLLAGLSQSEMTQAMYHRSLAAQNQSKVGDQWAFFQAKRIRGTVVEKNLDLLPGLVGKIEPEHLQLALRQVAARFERGLRDAEKLVAEVDRVQADLGTAREPLTQACRRLREVARSKAQEAKQSLGEIERELCQSDLKKSFAFLGTNQLPAVQEIQLDDPEIQTALQAVMDRKPENEMLALVGPISQSRLREALRVAETNNKNLEDAVKPMDRMFRALDGRLRKQVEGMHFFHRAAAAVAEALTDLPAGKNSLDGLRTTAALVARDDASIHAALEGLNDFKASQEDFTARRTDREARANQKAAGIYEIQVLKSSVDSDRHRVRSKNFFYGMLCAQAGVAISSLGLAARQKNLLWVIAGLAGMGGLGFSVYVYLYM